MIENKSKNLTIMVEMSLNIIDYKFEVIID